MAVFGAFIGLREVPIDYAEQDIGTICILCQLVYGKRVK